jgi:hypothetical protein
VLVVLAPGSRRRVLQRRISRRPWRGIEPGSTLRIGRAKLRVTQVEQSIERRGDDIEHVTSITTRAVRKRARRRPPSNVVPMPRADGTPLTDFLRYHVLVRVFDGDVDAWLAQLDDEGDVRFARRVRTRLRKDPSLLIAIRRMVDTTPFWGDVRVS